MAASTVDRSRPGSSVQTGLSGFDGGSMQPACGVGEGCGDGAVPESGAAGDGEGLAAGAPSTGVGPDEEVPPDEAGVSPAGSTGVSVGSEQPAAATASGTRTARSQRLTAMRPPELEQSRGP